MKYNIFRKSMKALVKAYPLSHYKWIVIYDAPEHVLLKPLYSIQEVSGIVFEKYSVVVVSLDGSHSCFNREYCEQERFDVGRCLSQYSITLKPIDNELERILRAADQGTLKKSKGRSGDAYLLLDERQRKK